MQSNNFWGTPRSSGVKVGLIVRISLALLATVGSAALAWTLLNSHRNVHATAPTTIVEVPTTMNPWGEALDSTGHIWVAEPGCNLGPSGCASTFAGVIGEYPATVSQPGPTPTAGTTVTASTTATTGAAIVTKKASKAATPSTTPPPGKTPTPGTTPTPNPGTSEVDFTEPSGFSSPAFVALDSTGNVWFTEPTTASIGELVPNNKGGIWHQWSTGNAKSSAPRDLVFDTNGNIWFTDPLTNSIGFFDTTHHKALETAIPTAKADPYGIIKDASGNIWFGENGNAALGTFTPSTNGTITITENPITTGTTAHMLALDTKGKNIWYSEGSAVQIGEFNVNTKKATDFPLASVLCPTPCSNPYIAGISVASNNMVWFDESSTGHVGFYDPVHTTTSVTTVTSSPFDGLVVDSSKNAWVTEKFAKKLATVPQNVVTGTPAPSTSPTVTGSPSPVVTPPSGAVPVNKSWYFAEGKVGSGFTQFITIENPDPSNACTVDVQYLLGTGTNPSPKVMTVQPASRGTTWVNSDLNMPASSTNFDAVSTVVNVDTTTSPNCKGVVAERPMYFTNFTGVSSGDDVVGFTKTGTKFLFADVPTGGGYSSFLTVLNPSSNTQAATVTATFYANGQVLGSPMSLQVNPGTRNTILPNNAATSVQHAAVLVTSTQPVMVERPSYFHNINGGNAGTVSGAASVIGVQADSKDWLFAEGYTGAGFQEDLVLSNFGKTVANASVKLEYSNGSTQVQSYPVQPSSQTLVDVNMLRSTGTGTCTPSPCQPTTDVSAEVTSDNPIVAQREMFFHYNSGGLASMGVSDATGLVASKASAYTFAEGYTNRGYNEWLTLQNPTASQETIFVTLVNGDAHKYQFTVTVGAHSRLTEDITSTVAANLIQAQDTYLGYEVSMTVQSVGNAFFVAERPMYWNASGTQGGSTVFGYTGG